MTLNDIFDQLSYGELAQVVMGTGDTGKVPEAERLRIAASVQLGLTALHKRFLLKEQTVQVDLVENQQSYILDVPDILMIERVYDDDGCELMLNVMNDERSIRTPTHRSLLVPDGLATAFLKVVYRANHPEFNNIYVEALPSKVKVDLPMTHLEPLLYYVASRVLNPVGMVSEFHEGNNYSTKYEASCQRLEQLNMRVDTQESNTRLCRNGWV